MELGGLDDVGSVRDSDVSQVSRDHDTRHELLPNNIIESNRIKPTSRGLPRGVWKKYFFKALTGGVCFCVRSFVLVVFGISKREPASHFLVGFCRISFVWHVKIYTCLLKSNCAEAALCRSSFGNEAG